MPADVAGFALLAHILAQELKVKPGLYSHSISNAHIYDIHYEAAKEIMNRNNSHSKINLTLPENSFKRADRLDRKLAEEIIDNLSSQYFPMEPIKNLKIVL
jgi:thymidylate synthase